MTHKITEGVGRKLEQEKKVYLIGTGGGMMHNVWMLAMSFEFYQELDIKTSRKLVVYIINEYLFAINTNENIRPYLSEYPFTANNVEIRVLFQKPNGDNPTPGNICCISATEGMIRYYNRSVNLLETIQEETFAEAQRIVLLENHKDTSK